MKKSLSRKSLFTLIILTIIAIIVPILFKFVSIHNLTNENKWKYCVENFEQYKFDYELVSDYCYRLFDDKEGKTLKIYYSYDNSISLFVYNNKKPILLDTTDEVLKCAEDINESLGTNDSYYNAIYVDKNRVSFITADGQYSFIRSYDDKKPEYLAQRDEDFSISVKEEDKCWYHVVRNN